MSIVLNPGMVHAQRTAGFQANRICKNSAMRHTLHSEGFGIRLRPVQVSDAAFIVWLRHLDYVNGRVGDSAPDVVSQQQWLERYFDREGDFYFVFETPGGIRLGTTGLYGIAGKYAEWGRYIVRPETPAALPAAILIFDLAFEKLGLSELLARCVSTNLPMHSLVKKWGFRQTETKPGEQLIGGLRVDMIHFVLNARDWSGHRERLLPLAEYAGRRIEAWGKSASRSADADTTVNGVIG